MYKMEYYVINAKFLWRNVTNVKKSIMQYIMRVLMYEIL